MASFLQKLFGNDKASKELAKDRLKLVLIHDRASLSPAMMDNLRRDLVEVISRYMDFDEAALDVQMAEQESMTMLEVNIPVAGVKRNHGAEK
ncbi:MAG: cell division topological specificity factor MinE [Peptococcaceae bacterium]